MTAYYIDAGGTQLKIRNSRIFATLIVKSSNETVIDNSIHWSPAAPNYPAMMIDGRLLMTWDAGAALSELSLLNNFNPSHTPYQGS